MNARHESVTAGTTMSVHVIDVSILDARRALRLARQPGLAPGLRRADVGRAAPFSTRVVPRPSLHRVVLVATWDDDDAAQAFAGDPLNLWAQGLSVHMQALRLTGRWPTVQAPTASDADGPAAVLTLGRLRARRAVDFFRTSARAEGQLLQAPGLVWATGMGMLPFVGTFSLWRSAAALQEFAYRAGSPHAHAIAADRGKPFHRLSAFIRLRPYASTGALVGANPIGGDWLDHSERDAARRRCTLTSHGPGNARL